MWQIKYCKNKTINLVWVQLGLYQHSFRFSLHPWSRLLCAPEKHYHKGTLTQSSSWLLLLGSILSIQFHKMGKLELCSTFQLWDSSWLWPVACLAIVTLLLLLEGLLEPARPQWEKGNGLNTRILCLSTDLCSSELWAGLVTICLVCLWALFNNSLGGGGHTL